MNVRRVAITGLGMVSPAGLSVDENFQNLLQGKSYVDTITHFDPTDFKVKIAAEILNFDPTKYMPKPETDRMDRFAQLAVAAGTEAFQNANIEFTPEQEERFAVIVGTGIGGNQTFIDTCKVLDQQGPSRISPYFIPKLIGNMGAALLAIRYGAKGYTSDVVTACASGTNAIGDAFKRIHYGLEDFALAGGSEAPVTPISIGGFSVMRALSKRNDEPKKASRPFDKDRDGFVVGEGAGIMFLEEWEHAIQRGAHIYAEIVGYGATCDAYHITKPSPDARQQTRCMQLAIQEAGIPSQTVTYINAHGTSTLANDVTETMAIKNLFGEQAYNIHIHSTKSMIGHTLGAAGGVEAIVAVKTLSTGKIHPTINLETPDPMCDLNYTPNTMVEDDIEYGLSNSFGFGGHNFSLLFKRGPA